MKNFLLTPLLCLLFAFSLSGQTVNDIPIAEIDSDYIQLVGTAKLFSTKIIVSVEFGQATKLFEGNKRVIKDAEGKNVEFNSMVDALNFFSALDYELVQAYAITIGNQNAYHYLMKRNK